MAHVRNEDVDMGEGARKREKREKTGDDDEDVGEKRGVREENDVKLNGRRNRDNEQTSIEVGEADFGNDTDLLLNFQEACRRYSRRCGLSW